MHSNFDSIDFCVLIGRSFGEKNSLFSVSKINQSQWSWSFCTSQWPRRHFPHNDSFFFIIYCYLFGYFFYIYFYHHYFFERDTEKSFVLLFHLVVIWVSLSCISSTFEDFFALDFELWIVFLYLLNILWLEHNCNCVIRKFSNSDWGSDHKNRQWNRNWTNKKSQTLFDLFV